MDGRQQRGMEIAATANIAKHGGVWLVPSQSGTSRYTVWPNLKIPRCTCPDHEEGGFKCKHIFAVEYVMSCEQSEDGSTTVTERLTIQKTVQRTYPQNWTAYNAAQTHEKAQFLDLLRDLCAGVSEPAEPKKNGRPRLSIQDALFAACFKVYSTVSVRRFMTDLRDAHAKSYITKVPHFNSICNYLENPSLTPATARRPTSLLKASIAGRRPACGSECITCGNSTVASFLSTTTSAATSNRRSQ